MKRLAPLWSSSFAILMSASLHTMCSGVFPSLFTVELHTVCNFSRLHNIPLYCCTSNIHSCTHCIAKCMQTLFCTSSDAPAVTRASITDMWQFDAATWSAVSPFQLALSSFALWSMRCWTIALLSVLAATMRGVSPFYWVIIFITADIVKIFITCQPWRQCLC